MKHWIFGRPNGSHVQFFRYFLVGGTSAVVDLVVFTLLVKFFGIWYPLAAFVSYMFGLSWNYITSIIWVFDSKHSRRKEMIMVFAIAIGGLLWTWLILYICIDIFGLEEITSKLISQALVLAWNYGMRKALVFH